MSSVTSFDFKLLNTIGGKLGIDSVIVLKKAGEFLRRVQFHVSGLRQLSDTCRAVMCVDLACGTVGFPIDKNFLPRLAGVNKKQYLNGLHLIESLLNLTKPVNIDTLCVQFGISEVVPIAQKILTKYLEDNSQAPSLDLPVYHCVAVFMGCKYNKVKVDRPKLVEASRVKKVQFDKLVKDFTPIIENMGKTEERKTATKRSHKLISLVHKFDDERTNDVGSNDNQEDSDEDYEEWKKRILSETDAD